MLVLTVNSSAIAVISPNIHPNKSCCQIYIHCKSASCKNAMYSVKIHPSKGSNGEFATFGKSIKKHFQYGLTLQKCWKYIIFVLIDKPSAPYITNATCYESVKIYLEWKRPKIYYRSVDYYFIYYREKDATAYQVHKIQGEFCSYIDGCGWYYEIWPHFGCKTGFWWKGSLCQLFLNSEYMYCKTT